MNQIIKKVLKKIENNGYEAYVVGGYVRDCLIGIKTYDIDICTNALPRELNKIFFNCQNNNYGGIHFKIQKYNFDITTYRKELKYKNRKPVKIEYVNNLYDDVVRRDFKMNALCMTSNEFVIDLVDGIKDIENRQVSMIGDPDEKFTEDPLRMLRAIRFMTILDFSLAENLYNSLCRNKDLILSLSQERIKDELDKILISPNAKKGLEILSATGILNVLKISYNNICYVVNPVGMWAQMNFEFNSSFTNAEKNTIINIRKILATKAIDNRNLFEYGLYQCLVAGEIMNVDKKLINKIYKNLPIYTTSDLKITSEEIMQLFDIKPGRIVGEIVNDLIKDILNLKVKNNYKDIEKYLIRNKTRWLK